MVIETTKELEDLYGLRNTISERKEELYNRLAVILKSIDDERIKVFHDRKFLPKEWIFNSFDNEWIFNSFDNNRVILRCKTHYSEPSIWKDIEVFFDVAKYHWCIPITTAPPDKAIFMSGDDEMYSLSIPVGQVKEFIEEFKLTVDLSNLNYHRSQLLSRLEVISKASDVFKVIGNEDK